jgi:hypothetical protein
MVALGMDVAPVLRSKRRLKMLHPDLRQALAIAHIEDLQREAARRQTIRLARRVAEVLHVDDASIAGQRSASDPPRQSRAPRPTAGHDERPSSLVQKLFRLGGARVRRRASSSSATRRWTLQAGHARLLASVDVVAPEAIDRQGRDQAGDDGERPHAVPCARRVGDEPGGCCAGRLGPPPSPPSKLRSGRSPARGARR